MKLYRTDKFRELVHSMMTIVNNAVLNTRNLLKVDCRCSHQKRRKKSEMDMLISLTVVIISFCISDCRVVYLKYIYNSLKYFFSSFGVEIWVILGKLLHLPEL